MSATAPSSAAAGSIDGSTALNSHSQQQRSPSYRPDTSAGSDVSDSGSAATTTALNDSVAAALSSRGGGDAKSRATLPPVPKVSGDGVKASDPNRPTHRRRASSIVVVKKIEQSQEEILDQSAGFNPNADWVNYKGAWVIHVVLVLFGKILLDVIPGIPQDINWTIVNLGYDALSFLMFHHVTGTPFDSNAGAYDQLTLWEQIDEGAQYTPAKKWLTLVPIGVFLMSTHYTRYNLSLFALNFSATLIVLFPKLPILHRLRFRIFPSAHSNFASRVNSPYPSRPNTPAVPESHSRGASGY
ncbi:unnamed protein product [Parajaminaea phylloscopi]